MTDVRSIVSGESWWHVSRQPTEDDTGSWLRVPIAVLALVDDGPSVPGYVAPMWVAADGTRFEVAPPVGRIVHESEFVACTCSAEVRDAGPVDAAWCKRCGGLVR